MLNRSQRDVIRRAGLTGKRSASRRTHDDQCTRRIDGISSIHRAAWDQVPARERLIRLGAGSGDRTTWSAGLSVHHRCKEHAAPSGSAAVDQFPGEVPACADGAEEMQRRRAAPREVPAGHPSVLRTATRSGRSARRSARHRRPKPSSPGVDDVPRIQMAGGIGAVGIAEQAAGRRGLRDPACRQHRDLIPMVRPGLDPRRAES